MKKSRRILALLLALVMLFSLTACGGVASEAQASSPAEESTPVEETVASEAALVEEAAAPEETPAEDSAPVEAEPETEEPVAISYSYPLFEETYEFELFWRMRRNVLEDLDWWKNFEANLGVDITWISPADTAAPEQYNLLIASGDYPDMIFENSCSTNMMGGCPYAGGYEKAIEDEVYLNLTEYLDEYAPNYSALLKSDESLHRDLSTDNGQYYCFSMVYEKPAGVSFGVVVRNDYLEQAGYSEPPTTTDEWEKCLRIMKSNGVEYPYGAFNTGDLQGLPFAYAFGTGIDSMFKVERATDKVVYDATSDETRAYLEFFSTLYKDGLVSPDYFSLVGFDDPNNTNGVNAIFGARDEKMEQIPTEYQFDLTACPVVTQPGKDVPVLCDYSAMTSRVVVGSDIVLTTGCEDIEKAMNVLDWFYSPEGYLACNYGWVQGETWDYDADGNPALFDWINDTNPETGNRYKDSYILDDGPFLCNAQREYPCYDPSVAEAKAIWDNWDFNATEYFTLPSVNLTADESEEIASAKSDIDTYVDTCLANFMTCQTELNDETWNEFVETVESMGIDRVTEVYTAAYARYKSR